MNEEKRLEETRGASLVGLSFNPNGNPDVDKLKRMFAQIINIVNNSMVMTGEEKTNIREHAIKEIMTAQMWAVKSATFKE